MANISSRDRVELKYLADSRTPLWGGHLKRGVQVVDSDIRRWLDMGLIKAKGVEGYVITPAGRAALQEAGR